MKRIPSGYIPYMIYMYMYKLVVQKLIQLFHKLSHKNWRVDVSMQALIEEITPTGT